jgi:hypothetical protein
MNKTNFVQTGGFPLNAERLEEIETAYSIFNAFGTLAGNLTIISGCVTSGSNVSDGYVYVNGELLAFKAGAVTPTSSVIIIEQKVNRPFENTEVKTVHTIRYATFGTAATSWLWTDFVRPIETKALAAALYAKADRTTLDNVINRLVNVETKLATIAPYAEVNVQSDMNVTDVNSDAFVKNKSATDILYRGSVNVGDTSALSGKVSERTVINFPDVGTAEYIVLGSLKSASGWDNDSGVFWTAADYATSSFALIRREIDTRVQIQIFEYILVRK